MNFGFAIKVIRKGRDLKQKELAKMLNVQATYLCAIEKGKKQPSMRLVKRISECLDCSVSLILWNAIEPPENATDIDKKSYEIAKEIIVKHGFLTGVK